MARPGGSCCLPAALERSLMQIDTPQDARMAGQRTAFDLFQLLPRLWTDVKEQVFRVGDRNFRHTRAAKARSQYRRVEVGKAAAVRDHRVCISSFAWLVRGRRCRGALPPSREHWPNGSR